MLILSRKPGETIVIGGEITVTVLAVRGNQVRIGVTAPKGVIVDREEIHQRRTASAAAAKRELASTDGGR